MKKLIWYEWKKIWSSHLTKILAAAVFVMLFLSCIGTVMLETAYDAEGNMITGTKAVALKKQYIKENEGYLTDDKVAEYISALKEWYNEPGENAEKEWKKANFMERYYDRSYYPKSFIYHFILQGEACFDLYKEDFDGENFMELLYDKVSFWYTEEMNFKQHLLQNEHGLYSGKQQKYLLRKVEHLKRPVYIGDAMGWQTLVYGMGSYSIALLVVCIGVAPVFGKEYKDNTVPILLAAKHGKGKMIGAKMIASFLYATVVFLAAAMMQTAVTIVFYGADGWNLYYQMSECWFGYSMTYLQMYLLQLLCIYMVILLFTGLNLLLSAYLKSVFPVAVLDMIVFCAYYILAFVLPESVLQLPFVTKFTMLFPAAQMMNGAANSNLLYSIGPVIGKASEVLVVLYLIVTVLCLLVAAKGFREHQVCG